MLVFLHGPDYEVRSNSEQGHGRPDIVVLARRGGAGVLLELKRTASESDIESKLAEATAQIRDRRYDAAFPPGAHVYAYAVAALADIGHGDLEGPFTELAGLPIERDPRFPVRVTVQFYKATSNGVLASADVASIKAQVKRVYKEADYVGSLVTHGYTGRPTEWEGDHREPADFWQVFWQYFEADTGLTPEETMRLLEERVTTGWHTGVGPSRSEASPLACLPQPLLSL